MALGAKGGVLAVASMLPKVWIEIYTLAASGRIRERSNCSAISCRSFAALFAESNPGPLKKGHGARRVPGRRGPTALRRPV